MLSQLLSVFKMAASEAAPDLRFDLICVVILFLCICVVFVLYSLCLPAVLYMFLATRLLTQQFSKIKLNYIKIQYH